MNNRFNNLPQELQAEVLQRLDTVDLYKTCQAYPSSSCDFVKRQRWDAWAKSKVPEKQEADEIEELIQQVIPVLFPDAEEDMFLHPQEVLKLRNEILKEYVGYMKEFGIPVIPFLRQLKQFGGLYLLELMRAIRPLTILSDFEDFEEASTDLLVIDGNRQLRSFLPLARKVTTNDFYVRSQCQYNFNIPNLQPLRNVFAQHVARYAVGGGCVGAIC